MAAAGYVTGRARHQTQDLAAVQSGEQRALDSSSRLYCNQHALGLEAPSFAAAKLIRTSDSLISTPGSRRLIRNCPLRP
jgi:hypothetical protein